MFRLELGADLPGLCYNPLLQFLIVIQEIQLVFLPFRSLVSIVLVLLLGVAFAFGQNATEKKIEAKPAATPSAKDPSKPLTAEQLVDSAVFVYGFPGGRATLNQIRKTTFERGKTNVVNLEGKTEAATYQRWIIRGESLPKERIRIDQDFPNARYSLVFADDKIYGIFNNTVFSPTADAAKSYENTIYRGLEALLRYKENESKVEMAGREKIMGVEYYLVDVTDKQERRTRFFVSVKSLRVMMLTYEEAGLKYRRKFYNHNYAQGTLVPYRSVLTANDKIVEETEISTITFGQKVDEELFRESKP